MILFHGSYLAVEHPDISFSRDEVDFGIGFYTTPFEEQARKWTRRYKDNGLAAVVSVYEFDTNAFEEIRVMDFGDYSGEWLDFIFDCRRGLDKSNYDLVVGGVANDKVFNTINLFFRNLIPKDEALRRLRYEKPNSQYCFRNQAVIDKYLKFVKREEA
jgi:hypothetical protein